MTSGSGFDHLQHQAGVAQDAGQQVVEIVRDAAGQQSEALQLLRVPQLLFQVAALGPNRGFAQLPADRRHQAAEPVLEDVVVGAGPHRLHGGLFADRRRDDDERNVEAASPAACSALR